jgi:hypothetical protein
MGVKLGVSSQREEYRLKAFKTQVLRRTFMLKREKLTVDF